MKKLVCALFLLASWPSAAEDYAVVISAKADLVQLEERMIRDVFLKKRQFARKLRLLPVNITGDVPARRAFELTVLGMTRDELNQYWIENHFHGVSPPGTQASFAALKKIVQRVDGAITYLPRDMVDDRVQVIYEF